MEEASARRQLFRRIEVLQNLVDHLALEDLLQLFIPLQFLPLGVALWELLIFRSELSEQSILKPFPGF
jgi:hypothetical protein